MTPNISEFLSSIGVSGPLTSSMIATARCFAHPNFKILVKLVTICIPNNWIPDSTEYQTVWVPGIQMNKSRDLADHSNYGHFGPSTGFFQSGFQITIWIPDHLTMGHKSTIWIPDYSQVFRWLLYFKIDSLQAFLKNKTSRSSVGNSVQEHKS